jgi:hypothetical protein
MCDRHNRNNDHVSKVLNTLIESNSTRTSRRSITQVQTRTAATTVPSSTVYVTTTFTDIALGKRAEITPPPTIPHHVREVIKRQGYADAAFSSACSCGVEAGIFTLKPKYEVCTVTEVSMISANAVQQY